MTKQRKYLCLRQQEVVSGQFTLKTIQDDDIEDIRKWRNSQIDILRQSTPISREQQIAYFEQKIWPAMDQNQPKNILLTFFEDGRRIGYGGLVHIAWEHRRAEVSFLINSTCHNKAETYSRYFSNYLSLIKKFGFSILKFNRLYTETYEFRYKHVTTLESSGFNLEGRMRQHVIIRDRFVDSLIHGALNEE